MCQNVLRRTIRPYEVNRKWFSRGKSVMNQQSTGVFEAVTNTV